MASTVYFGPVEDMVAEVGACDMGAAWLADCGYTHAVLMHPEDGAQWDTQFYTSHEDAKAEALYLANQFNASVGAL